MLFRHWVVFARSLAPRRAGRSIAARTAMMATTTKSSIKVNALLRITGNRILPSRAAHNRQKQPRQTKRAQTYGHRLGHQRTVPSEEVVRAGAVAGDADDVRQ